MKIYFKRFGKWYNRQTSIARMGLIIIGVNAGYLLGRLIGYYLWG